MLYTVQSLKINSTINPTQLSVSSFFYFLLADTSDEEPSLEELLAKLPPPNPDLIDMNPYPKCEEAEPRDEEGNLIVNGVPLKKVEVKPLDVSDYLKEEWPTLELMVHHMQ